jgi:hypothetical protein
MAKKSTPRPPITRAELLSAIAELPVGAFLTPVQAAALLGTTTGVLASWRDQKRGPRFHGFREFIRYTREDLDVFMAERANEVADAEAARAAEATSPSPPPPTPSTTPMFWRLRLVNGGLSLPLPLRLIDGGLAEAPNRPSLIKGELIDA